MGSVGFPTGQWGARGLCLRRTRRDQILETKFELPPFFVLPGATPGSAGIDLARSVLRRAERLVVHLEQSGSIKQGSAVLPYINRVSDLLFILARYEDRNIDTELLNGDK